MDFSIKCAVCDYWRSLGIGSRQRRRLSFLDNNGLLNIHCWWNGNTYVFKSKLQVSYCNFHKKILTSLTSPEGYENS